MTEQEIRTRNEMFEKFRNWLKNTGCFSFLQEDCKTEEDIETEMLAAIGIKTKEEYKRYFRTIPLHFIQNGLIDVDKIYHNDGTVGYLPATENGYIEEQFTEDEWRELNLERLKQK